MHLFLISAVGERVAFEPSAEFGLEVLERGELEAAGIHFDEKLVGQPQVVEILQIESDAVEVGIARAVSFGYRCVAGVYGVEHHKHPGHGGIFGVGAGVPSE